VVELRTIEGFVCVAIIETRVGKDDALVDRQIFFGPPVNQNMVEKGYEAMASNNLKPFATFEEAQWAQIKLAKRKYQHKHQQLFKEVWIGRLKMEMAESDGENRDLFFENSDSLIVVVQFERGWQLVGRLTSDEISLYPRLGADLFENGLTPFNELRMALFVQNDSQRQSWTPCRLATFSLERVDG